MSRHSDLDLLRQFAREQSQDAFREIVRRHLNLVYSTARRQIRSLQLAEEIAQSVFSDLARNAGKLRPETNLTAWLYAVTRRTATDAIRKESRRQAREQIAVEIQNMNATENTWNQIEPFLDEAMASLDEADRAAILLRYFENQSLREVGANLQISDDAAQKRVSRAVEKLREFFSKRNVTIGASGLTVLISANAVQSAPLGLAVTISAAVLTGTAVSSSTAIAVTKTIVMTTIQKSIIGAAFIAAIGTGIFEAHQASQLRGKNQNLQQQQTDFTRQIQQLQNALVDLTNRFANVLAENARLKSSSNQMELLKLRGEVGVLQSAINDPAEKAAKAWVARVNQLKQRLQENPGAGIPEFQFLDDEDWLAAVKNRSFDSEDDYRRAFSTLRNTAEDHFANTLNAALQKYLKANNRQFPTDLNQLQSYFDSPVDDAILQRWEIAPAKTVPNIGVSGSNGTIITQKTAVDDLLDTRMAIGSSGFGSTDFLGTETSDVMKPVYKAYLSANGTYTSDLSQLLPYATTPEQQAAIQKLIDQQALRK